jgi:hypothetical protein
MSSYLHRYANRACLIKNTPLPNNYASVEEDLLPSVPMGGAAGGLGMMQLQVCVRILVGRIAHHHCSTFLFTHGRCVCPNEIVAHCRLCRLVFYLANKAHCLSGIPIILYRQYTTEYCECY